jgi:Mn-dependent DtxR family transcriptional regulator
MTMMLQGTQWDVLQTIVDMQQATSGEEVEDIEIAEEIGLDIRLVRSALRDLAKEGDVKLKKSKTLSGLAYSAFLTNQGQATLIDSQTW